MPKADGDACDDDKLRQNAVRDVVRVDDTEPVDCVLLLILSLSRRRRWTKSQPDNVNDLVSLGGRVFEGMVEALGLEVDVEAARVSMLFLLMRCGSGIQLRIGFSDVLFT